MLEDIEIDYHLSVLKPLHATWLIYSYDYISSLEGKAVIASEWKKLGVFNAFELGLSKLPVLDPFNAICPLMKVVPPKETSSLASLFPQELKSYKTKVADETDKMNRNGRSITQMKILIKMMNRTMMCATHLICLEISKWKHFSIFFISSSLYSLVFLYDFVLHHKESFISLFANDCTYTSF